MKCPNVLTLTYHQVECWFIFSVSCSFYEHCKTFRSCSQQCPCRVLPCLWFRIAPMQPLFVVIVSLDDRARATLECYKGRLKRTTSSNKYQHVSIDYSYACFRPVIPYFQMYLRYHMTCTVLLCWCIIKPTKQNSSLSLYI